MPRLAPTRLALALPVAACAAGVGIAAAAPSRGSISGPITAVRGSTFEVKTSLSPTGTSTVTLGKKATVVEQKTGRRSDLRKGVCVLATGTTKNKVVDAARISITGRTSCTTPFRGRRPNRTGNQPPRPRGNGNGNGNGTGHGPQRPADFGLAFGTISAVDGSTLTVKGARGTTAVAVTGKTAITETARVGASALATSLCAFVFGTSSDRGVTVQATNVELSKPVNGSCQARRGP
jgi:hypothetical protein